MPVESSKDRSQANKTGTVGDGPDSSTFGLASLWKIVEPRARGTYVDPLLGNTLGEFRLIRLIAEGGMGRVYEALQERPNRSVAVKVLRPGMVSHDAYRRFMQEVEILGRLRHPWIAQVISAGTCDFAESQAPYFVMELISDALPITEYVSSQKLSLESTLALFRQVCDAVEHGHRQGIIHRDLKPSNILVDVEGYPKVIDFGVASVLGGSGATTALTDIGQLVGTLQYMSPEQFAVESPDVDPRSDVYSLGVVLYELLAGRPPYSIGRQSVVQAAKMIEEYRPVSPARLNKSVSLQVAAIATKCLEKNRLHRFVSAAEVSLAIHECLITPPQARTQSLSDKVALRLERLRNKIHRLKQRVAHYGKGSTGILVSVFFGVAAVGWILTSRGFFSDTLGSKTAGKNGSHGSLLPLPGSKNNPSTGQRFSIRDVSSAFPYLIKSVGVRLFREWQQPPVTYWGPEADGQEARLIFKFDFAALTRSIRIQATSQCWDFVHESGGIGRGASAIEASRDGETWIAIRNN